MGTILLKGASVVNVFTDTLEQKNVLLENGRIIGVDNYDTADEIIDVTGKFICPGFIDSHIHIESSMLIPEEFVRATVPCGTLAVVADPHEIANVCGVDGISYMLEDSKDMPMNVYIALPSCVPATGFDEAGAVLNADELKPFYSNERVVSLGEMMNYPGVIYKDEEVIKKINQAKDNGRVINGHAPLVSGHGLDSYISAGITDDHECTSIEEAKERISKGQMVMIRQGTSSRNLEALIDLFDEPYSRRCMLAADDKHPMDLIKSGHIDAIIRMAVKSGKSVFTAIRMASVQAAQYYGIRDIGAIAPGYKANILILNDLETVDINEIYFEGKSVYKNGKLTEIKKPVISEKLENSVRNSFNINLLSKDDFIMKPDEKYNHVIQVLPGELLTNDYLTKIDFSQNNGIDIEKDIIKIAVCERYKKSGHIGLAFVNGMKLLKGAIASSVSHDSHNLIVVGTSEEEMALAANTCIEMGGGLVAVLGDEVLAKLELPIGGIMSDEDAYIVADKNEKVRNSVYKLGADENIEPFMNMAFLSLPVIPHLKITTKGLVNVDTQEYV